MNDMALQQMLYLLQTKHVKQFGNPLVDRVYAPLTCCFSREKKNIRLLVHITVRRTVDPATNRGLE